MRGRQFESWSTSDEQAERGGEKKKKEGRRWSKENRRKALMDGSQSPETSSASTSTMAIRPEKRDEKLRPYIKRGQRGNFGNRKIVL